MNQTSQVLDWLCLWHFVISRTKCETIIHTLPVFWYFFSLQQETLKSRIFTIWSSYIYSEYVALSIASYRKTCKYYNEDKCHSRKSIHFDDTSFIRYKAIAKHSSTCRAILVFFLIIKYTHLLCIFQLKSNFCEKHDNLSKHGFKNTAAFSVQLLQSKGNLPSIL